MSVEYNVKASIRRAIETGELLYLDYVNQEMENKFYFFGIQFLDFHKDDSKITGYAYNYQYQDALKITIPISRIQDAKCVEGTRHFHNTNLSNLMKVPEINNYFRDETSEKTLLDYYASCVEGSTDLQWVSSYFTDSVDVDMLKQHKRHELSKEEINEVLMMLNVKEEKAREKYKLAFNILSVSNFAKDILPIAYYNIYLDVFRKELIIDDKEILYHHKNMSELLQVPINDLETYSDVEDLRKDLEDVLRNGQLTDTNPALFKLKIDLRLSVRRDYKVIKNTVYSKDSLSPGLSAFFGRYKESLLLNNKNVYFTNNLVNSKQIEAVYSSMNKELTYVQGPPGTGKTQTITNIIISSLLNQENTLVTSYTNEAVNNIYRKMMKYEYSDIPIPIPMLRLGSKVQTKKGMNYVRRAYNHYVNVSKEYDFRKLSEIYTNSIEEELNKLRGINKLFDENQKFEDVEMKLDIYNKLLEAIPTNNANEEKINRVKKLRAAQRGVLTKLIKKDLDNYLDNIKLDYDIIKLGLLLESVKRWGLLEETAFKQIRDIIVEEKNSNTVNDFYQFAKDHKQLQLLKQVFPIIFTTNISSRNIGDCKPNFDLLIMDEAGQCENAYSLIALSKAKRAALIGDPNQLLPVITLSDRVNEVLKDEYNIPDVYDYKQTSILNTMNQVDFANDIILLNKHYRCKRSIVDFANKKYYNSALDIQEELISDEDCKFVNCVSRFYQNKKNTSVEETMAIIEELRKLPADQSVGIITPYRNQQSFLNQQIKKHIPDRKVKVGTVHKFQGQEEDVIMLSLAIGRDSYKGSYDWLKNNKQLINVATTRPKEQLIVVGDRQAIEQLSEGEPADITDLIRYTSKFNVESFDRLSVGAVYDDISKKSLYFGFETLFIDTLQRVLSINHKHLYPSGQVSVQQLLRVSSDHELYEYSQKATFDFVIFNHKHQALIAIELCGPEHAFDPVVKRRDKMKQALCKQHRLDLLFVNNRDSRRYDFIKNVVNEMLKKKTIQVGTIIKHTTFGTGKVISVTKNTISVDFGSSRGVIKLQANHKSISIL